MSGIAEQLLKKADAISEGTFRTTSPRLVILSGEPGRGKTHLLESIINKVGERPSLRKNLTYFQARIHPVFVLPESDKKGSIFFVDDFLYDKEHEEDDLIIQNRYKQDLKWLIRAVCDERALVVVTTREDLDFFEQYASGVRQGLDDSEKSRLFEILSEIKYARFDGNDFREIKAKLAKSMGSPIDMNPETFGL